MSKKIVYIVFLVICTNCLIAQTKEECYKMIVDGVEEMNRKNHVKSLEILTEAKTIAQENEWHKENFLALNNIGLNYYLMLDYGEALNNLYNAYLIALKELDRDSEMIALNNIAINYLKDDRLNKAKAYFEDAYNIAVELQDSLKVGIYSLNLASVSNELNEIDDADFFLTTAFEHLKKDSTYCNKKILTKVDNLILRKQYDKALSILNEQLPELDSVQIAEDRFQAFFLLTKIYQGKNQWTKAINSIKKIAGDSAVTLENRKDVYIQLADLYSQSGNLKSALAYKDSLIWSKDSLNKIKNGKLFENSRIKFELENYQKELSKSHEQLRKEKQKLYKVLGIIVLILLISFWTIRNYFFRIKKDRIIAQNNHKIAALEFEKEKNKKLILEKQLNEQNALILLEKERFKNEIEKKNRELTTKALSVSTRNDLIEDILKTLTDSKDVAQNEFLRRRIMELKKHLNKQSQWDDFFKHFEEVNQGFIENLKEKHPNLTAKDIRFLSYLYMNLSTKEIASLFNITVEACRKRKERIIKKMNIDETTSLFNYLSSF